MVNNWVDEETDHKINKIIESGKYKKGLK
ncbi:hypothetical protein DD595_26185 [Enterobacter cloacae complex sp. 4DZ3-17B2]|nr:hypothetical protein DD595_26185 [Enterobacter cloacae complex sp. 4DZ3-17B2]